MSYKIRQIAPLLSGRGLPAEPQERKPRSVASGVKPRAALLALGALCLAIGSCAARGATLTVTNTTDSGPGSLRQAILSANLSANVPDLVQFNIAGAGPHTINPLTPLPTLTDPVTMDGYSQSGASMNSLPQGDNAVLKIVVLDTLVIDTTNSTVRGLAVRQIQLGAAPGPKGGNVIEGNFIGLDATGTNALASAGSGVFVQTPNNRIGGSTPGARNLISGHGTTGMEIFEAFASGNLVQGNYIGTDRTGTKAIANTDRALVVNQNASGTTIGGTVPGAGNVISGNLNRGITLDGFNNVVQGNFIGTDVTGLNPLGNARSGVEISGPGNTVGGTNSGAGNVIAFNGVDGGGFFTTNGVDVAVGATGYAILGNSIFDNAGLGIDVNANGLVTAGYPVLTVASNSGAGTVIRGTHTPSSNFRLELFSNPAPDPSGYGEGRTLLVSTNITTDGSGIFNLNWPASLAPGVFLTATANGITEFSQARMVVAAGGPNSWTNSAGGKWENATNWSLRVAPYIGHSLVLITNAATKTVTNDATTASVFPTTLTISNLLISAPVGATNTLLLAHGGTTTPLTVRSNLTINAGGALAIQNAGLRLEGPFNTGLRIDGTASLANGLIQITNDATRLIVGNNGRGTFSVSDGTVRANYAIVGANSGSDGTWHIAGGSNVIAGGAFDIADSLTATGTVLVTGGRLEVPNAYVGLFGNGRLVVSNGVVQCAGTVLVASQDGAQGSFVAAGGTSTFGGMLVRESSLASGSVLVTGNAQVQVNGPLDNRGAVTVSGGNFTVLGQIESDQPGNSISVNGGQFAATNDNAFLTSVTVSNGTFLARDVFLGNQKAGTFTVAGGVVAAPGSLNGFNVGVNGGTGTVWQTGGQINLTNTDLNIGGLFSPATGLVTISNGATYARTVFIGGQGGGTGVVTVAGGTLAATNLFLGSSSSQNRLIASNGAVVVNSNAFLGYDTFSRGNNALITGAGTLWSNRQTLIVGQSGSSNRVVVSEGARLETRFATLGVNSSSSNNEMIVTGPGSFWRIEQNFTVGSSGSGNRLVITNGGRVRGSGLIGFLTSSNNEVVVTGSGSSWTNGGTLFVGSVGGGNRLVISDGGEVIQQPYDVIVGGSSSSLNNRLVVDGGSLRVVGPSSGVLDVRHGTNVLNAGLIGVDKVLLTNAAGWFEFNGGTLSVLTSTVSNGRVFRVGNGLSPAALVLSGNGAHSFSNGLSISANAALTGNGTVIAGVTNAGTIGPGASAGSIVITGPLVLSNSSALQFELGGTIAGSQYDQLNVSNTISHAGTVNVQLINGFTPVGGPGLPAHQRPQPPRRFCRCQPARVARRSLLDQSPGHGRLNRGRWTGCTTATA